MPAIASRSVWTLLTGSGLAMAALMFVVLQDAPPPFSSADLIDPIGPDSAPVLVITADARDLPRGLLRCREFITVTSGRNWLWFPRWIPGTHAPNGPIENVGELHFRTTTGQELAWRRDDVRPARFAVDVPAGCTTLQVDLTYLANQPSPNSEGVDSYGSPRTGVINWNTCLLYPEGRRHDQTPVQANLILPAGWRCASALTSIPSLAHDGRVSFMPTDLAVLVDSPVIAGRDLASHDISRPGTPPAFIDVVAEPPAKAVLPDKAVSDLRCLVEEAGLLFGGYPWTKYHLLLAAGNTLPTTGLEHAACSLNGVGAEELLDDGRLKAEAALLLAHEFGHAWCGKQHRPRGMATPDFHTEPQQNLLWVYEGLDQWLGLVLAARAGLIDREEWDLEFKSYLGEVARNTSRRWRTIEDTSNVSHLLRAPSQTWGYLRGSQDYYLEGMLFWMEADGLIRRHSGGQRSLDDFCRSFLGPREKGQVVPYDEADVIAALKAVDPQQDWAALVGRRIRSFGEPPLDTLKAVGYQVTWDGEPDYPRSLQIRMGYVEAEYSLGMNVAQGKIMLVLPGSAADAAGLSEGMSLIGVGNQAYSAKALIEAIEACAPAPGADPVPGQIAIRAQSRGGKVFPATLTCSGPRTMAVEAIPGEPDLLTRILAPRRRVNQRSP